MSKPLADTSPLYWLGNPINAMTKEELQQALRDANIIMESQKRELYKLRRLVDTEL